MWSITNKYMLKQPIFVIEFRTQTNVCVFYIQNIYSVCLKEIPSSVEKMPEMLGILIICQNFSMVFGLQEKSTYANLSVKEIENLVRKITKIGDIFVNVSKPFR